MSLDMLANSDLIWAEMLSNLMAQSAVARSAVFVEPLAVGWPQSTVSESASESESPLLSSVLDLRWWQP